MTLCNRRELDPDAPPHRRARDRIGKSLFEARVECVSRAVSLSSIRASTPSLLTEEEQELEFQYREQRIYAVGHGAAADWEVRPGRAARIRSDFMPEAEVPMMTVDTGDEDVVLDLARLAVPTRRTILPASPKATPTGSWSSGTSPHRCGLPRRQATANRICARMNLALARMRGCVEMLRTDPLAAESFRLANRAMLDQMRQADRVAGKETGNRPLPVASLPVGLFAHGHGVRKSGKTTTTGTCWTSSGFRPAAARPKRISVLSRSSSSGGV